jgi:hypothetical protein
MKKTILTTFSILLIFLLSFVVTANAFNYPNQDRLLIASYLEDFDYSDGGWAIEGNIYIGALKSSKKYTISVEELKGHNSNGLPLFKKYDSVIIPIKDDDYRARGKFVCYRKSKGFMDNPVVVLLHKNKPFMAWIVRDKKLRPIPVKTVECETEENHGD